MEKTESNSSDYLKDVSGNSAQCTAELFWYLFQFRHAYIRRRESGDNNILCELVKAWTSSLFSALVCTGRAADTNFWTVSILVGCTGVLP